MIWATGETVTGQRLDLATLRRQDIQIRAKPLDGQLRLHAGQQLADVGRNRLGKRE